MKLYDAHTLQSHPAPQINWLVDGLIPLGTPSDLFSMPECSKSGLVLTLAATVANCEGSWNGFSCAAGDVVIVGGEKSSEAVWMRDFQRLGVSVRSPSTLRILNLDSHIWSWDGRSEAWNLTPEATKELIPFLKAYQPVLVVVDTISRAAKGNDPLKLTQQVELGRAVEAFQRDTVGSRGLVLTVSHTSQASDALELVQRLHYMSRQGGNGYPGWLRHLQAITELKDSEKLDRGLNTQKRFIAYAISKCSEMPPPVWGERKKPLIFELTREGRLVLQPENGYVSARYSDKQQKKGGSNNGRCNQI